MTEGEQASRLVEWQSKTFKDALAKILVVNGEYVKGLKQLKRTKRLLSVFVFTCSYLMKKQVKDFVETVECKIVFKNLWSVFVNLVEWVFTWKEL